MSPLYPHLVVAAILEKEGRFLIVEEETSKGVRWNNPAGHVEYTESALDAVIRETREETKWDFTPTHFLGVYQWVHPVAEVHYVRLCFTGSLDHYDEQREFDKGILGTRWLTLEELKAQPEMCRSPLVIRCIEDYLHQPHYPLTALSYLHKSDFMPAQ